MSVIRSGLIAPEPAEAYRGTFAAADVRRDVGAELPPAWEGVYFPFTTPLANLRPDGTPARDGVIPEVGLPRRMYAGETTYFTRPVRIGDTATQSTRLGSIVEKTGSSGRLMFVDVERELVVDGEVAIQSTWHDVFLNQADPDASMVPPRVAPDVVASAEWIDELTLDARQLFRFSALTFNTHRIHYDRAWARDVEGLPDLLVHGPLTRILLMDAARRHESQRVVHLLDVRAIAPISVDLPIRLAGRTISDVTTVTVLGIGDVVLAVAKVTWA